MTRLFLVSALAAFLPLAACGGGDNGTGNGDPDAGPGEPDAGGGGITPVPLDRAHAGGNPAAVTVAGDYAYIAVGPRLEIWNVADSSAPARAGETPPFGGLLSSVAVTGAHAYVVERLDLDSVIHIVDVSDPAAPEIGASFRTVEEGGYSVVHDLVITGGRLYAADQEHGIFVFDLADPAAPEAVTLLEHTGVTDLDASDTRLYYTAESFVGGAFGVIDLEKPYTEIGSTGLFNVKGTAVSANDLLVTVGLDGVVVYEFVEDEFWTINEVYRYDGLFSREVAAAGTTAWVPAWDGLHVLDLSDPKAITRTGPLSMPTADAEASAVVGDLLTITTARGNLITVDVADPTAPTMKGELGLSVCTGCSGVAVAPDGTLLIADVAAGLRTARLQDLGAIGHATLAEMVAMEEVAAGDGLAFLSDWFYGLHIFDVSDPAAPVLRSSLQTGGFPSSVSVEGDRVVVGESTNGGAIHVIDVSDPEKPNILGSTATSKARGVVLRGDLVYVADESLDAGGGLRIFDVSDPTAITQVGHYDQDCPNAIGVALEGNLVALACGFDGFHLVDVSDPSAPTRHATWPAGGNNSGWSVALDGDRAYLGHDTGVIALDVSSPKSPALLQTWPVAYTARQIAVPWPGRVVVASALGGLYQFELD